MAYDQVVNADGSVSFIDANGNPVQIDPATGQPTPPAGGGNGTPPAPTSLTPGGIADILAGGRTTAGQGWNIQLPGNWLGVPYNQSFGGVPGPQATGYDSLGAQILDTLGMAGRYASAWPWGNKAARYNFGNGMLGNTSPVPPPALPATGGGGILGGLNPPPAAGGGMPPPTATGGTGGFGPVPPGTPPAGNGQQFPGQQTALDRWNALTNQDARDAFLLGMDANTHNALLAAGAISAGDINAAGNRWGGYAGIDRDTGRLWVSRDGNTREYLS